MNRIISMLLMILTVVCMTGCTSFKSIAQRDAEYKAWFASGGVSNSITAFALELYKSELEKSIAEELEANLPVAIDKIVNGEVEQSNIDLDATDYSALKWTYGGWNGHNCQWDEDQPRIQNLAFNPTGLSYAWVVSDSTGKNRDLSIWGLAHSDAGAICCLFVQRSDGSWVGGKFDWISSSRLTRGFKEHVIEVNGKVYNGWSLEGVPNPCQAAFVICHKDGSRRSNVLVSTWRR